MARERRSHARLKPLLFEVWRAACHRVAGIASVTELFVGIDSASEDDTFGVNAELSDLGAVVHGATDTRTVTSGRCSRADCGCLRGVPPIGAEHRWR